VSDERRAIERLIRQVDEADKIRTEVPRRIFGLFAFVILFGFALMYFALSHGRRDRPIPRSETPAGSLPRPASRT
jgi:hypothetical protein